MVIVGQGALARADGAAVLSLAARIGLASGVGKDGWNGFNVLHTRRRAASAASTWASCRARAATTRRQMVAKGATRRSSVLLGADEIDLDGTRTPSSSIWAPMATPAPHRADVDPAGRRLHREERHLRQHRGPRAAGATAPCSRRARQARTGRSCGRCPSGSATSCPTTAWTSCARRCIAEHPHLRALDRSTSAPIAALRRSPSCGATGRRSATPFARPIADFYLTNPIARASVTMAECSRPGAARSTSSAAE